MDYELDDDPARLQRDIVWQWLSTEAYWGRWRTRAQIETQIEDGPGRDMRWTLFTGDAHELYRQFGFTEPDHTAMVRPAAQGT